MISMFIKKHTCKKNVYTCFRMVVYSLNYWSWNESGKESCERVNGKEVYLIHEPMAAIGIGIDIMQPKETL
jgi:actin-like ATPase involved in cell morphogenesis